ncbi:hypothetical protein [Bacillus sp. AFS017274]|uniref:hypothetical protein n=1 Tax=Bacillus sp. AFS017274 TaxID=2033488 RepID=UPI000BF6FC1B|nr:hypothetical protein [Bacillus sp. AFS017274]PEZ76356.1 hypothetical protein CN380_21425 [Bacillus sp. AFS017274]
MRNFTMELKNLFAESFIDNFKTVESQTRLIRKFTSQEIYKPSFYPTSNDFHQHAIKEFKYRLETLHGDEFLELWERVIRKRTTEHTSSEPPEVTDDLKVQLIAIVRSELHRRKNEFLDSVESWGNFFKKDSYWGGYAEAIITDNGSAYKRLLDFLRLLEPVEIVKHAVELTTDLKDKAKEADMSVDISGVEVELDKVKESLQKDHSFADRFPNHLESALVAAGLSGILALLKLLFGF